MLAGHAPTPAEMQHAEDRLRAADLMAAAQLAAVKAAAARPPLVIRR